VSFCFTPYLCPVFYFSCEKKKVASYTPIIYTSTPLHQYRFYRWFPDFEERFTKDQNGQYQPVNGHENEMKYRKEMRYKSSVDVSAKRSHALTKRKKCGGVVVPVAKKAVMSPVSRQVSNMSNGNDSINSIGIGTNYPDGVVMGLPQMLPVPTQVSNISNGNHFDNINIGIGTNYPDVVNMGLPRIAHIVMPSSPTTFPSVIDHQNSFFFDSGNRAPSPMALPQQPTLDDNNSNMAVAEEAQDTIFSFVSQDGSEDNVVEHLPSHWQVKQNIFDEVDKEFYGGNNDNDSVEGSLGVVSNSASSSSGSSLQDVQSDIEDCLEVMAEILETSR